MNLVHMLPKEAAIKWSADPNMTLQSIFIDVLWLNFPIFS